MIIKQNDMDFEPSWETIVTDSTADTCSIQWRVSQVSCWTDWYWDPGWQTIGKNNKPNLQTGGTNPNTGYTIYEPCNEDCCARQLRVCRYGKDSVSIQDLGELTEGGNCDTVQLRTMDCYDVCDYLKDFDELYPKIPAFEDSELNEERKIDTVKTMGDDFVIVYYYDNYIRIIFENTVAANVDISIYNITGKLTINKSQKIMSGRKIIEIDISSLISGVYIYRISTDGILVKTGKFHIIR